MITYVNKGLLRPNLRRRMLSGFSDVSRMLIVKIRVLYFTTPTPWGHPCFLQVLGQSDQADMLHKGSRAKGWSLVVAQNPSREEKDQAQASRVRKLPHFFLVFLTVPY